MSVKILTIDDSKTIRLIVAKSFKPYDCTVIEAENGVVGLAAATRERPDIILLDCHMPNMNGIETIRRLRENPFWAHIPIIVTTGDVFSATIERLLEAGATTYLKKPIDHLALRKAISLYLKKLPQN